MTQNGQIGSPVQDVSILRQESTFVSILLLHLIKLPLITEQRRIKKKKTCPTCGTQFRTVAPVLCKTSLLNRLALYTVQTIPHALTNELVIRASKTSYDYEKLPEYSFEILQTRIYVIMKVYLNSRPRFLWVCRRNKPTRDAGGTRKNLANHEPQVFLCSPNIPSGFITVSYPQKMWSIALIEHFHMTSQRPHWCSKTKKRRLCF